MEQMSLHCKVERKLKSNTFAVLASPLAEISVEERQHIKTEDKCWGLNLSNSEGGGQDKDFADSGQKVMYCSL